MTELQRIEPPAPDAGALAPYDPNKQDLLANPVGPNAKFVATIAYLRPVLTRRSPFNAIAYAEAAPVFPNDRLSNQTYDFKRFDTYRSLGFAQTTNAWLSTFGGW